MVSISQALETAIAAIILIVLVTVFFNVFGSKGCEGFANTTALDLTDAINRAALEDGVRPWTEGGMPSDDDTKYYVPVQIRLCEDSAIDAFMSMFSAQQPTDIITYGQFPQEGFAWSEAQPFGGGAGQSVLNYAVMKYGIKSAGWFQKYASKFVNIVVKGTVRVIMYPWEHFLSQKIAKSYDNFIRGKAIERVRKLFRMSNELSDDVEKRNDILNPKYIDKKNSGMLSKTQSFATDQEMNSHQAILESSVLKGKDGGFEKFIDPKDGKLKYKVASEARDFINNLKAVATTPEDKAFLDTLYVSPKFTKLGNKISNLKNTIHVPAKFKNYVMDSRGKKYTYDVVSSVYKKITGWYRGAKTKVNSWLNFEKGFQDTNTLAIQTGNLKRISLRAENREVVRYDMIKRIATDANLKSDLSKLAGKTITSADDVTDDLVVKYISSQTRAQALSNLVLVSPRDLDKLDELTEVASVNLAKDIKASLEKVQKSQNPQYELNLLKSKYVNNWEVLPQSEKEKWLEELSKGYKINGQEAHITAERAKEVYEFTRLSMADRGVFEMTSTSKGLKSAAQNIQNDLFKAGFKQSKKYSATSVIDYFSRPILDSSNLDKIAARKATTYLWQRTKRGVLLDLNRIGQGYDPFTGTVPISFASVNIIPGEYSIKEGLNKETQDCGNNELCKITRGVATGATSVTEYSSSYPFDDKVEGNLQVKLYRPKPGLWERTPIGISTGLFYTSVSGCSDPSTCPEESPNFYVVSPCFATAKVWKSADGTIFVSMEKEKKCDVSSCEQSTVSIDINVPSMTIPFIGLQTPSHDFGDLQLTPGNADTPNYCFADAEYIWGEDLSKGNLLTTGDVPSEYTHFAAYGICAGVCTAALTAGTFGAGSAAAIRTCLKPCAMIEIGVLFGEATAATRVYADMPSWERQSTGWGYWNYQKAADICDWLDAISSMGGKGFAGAKKVENAFFKTSTGAKLWTAGSKISKLGIGMTDMCYGFQLIGDTSLSWPVKTPQPEFWRKAATLNEQCMQESSDKCVFLKKCDANNPCDSGWSCIDSVCKKVSQ